MTATLYDAGPTSCVIALGPIRATYSRRVWLGLHVVPVRVLRAAAAEMGRA